MKGPFANFSLRSIRPTLAGALGLALLGVSPASAASHLVYWDRADYGFGEGIGVSEATALAAQSDGIPILDVVDLGITLQPNTLVVDHDLSKSSLVLPSNGDPATITSLWDAENNVSGLNDGSGPNENQTLYLVYAHPTTNTITVSGQTHTVTYDEADVGLVLTFGAGGDDWVIIKTPIDSSSNYAYLPAVSLGTLAFNATDGFSLHYSLQNPQVFQGTSIDKLGLPKWELAFARGGAPIPEPSSGLLMYLGLLGIARARRKHG